MTDKEYKDYMDAIKDHYDKVLHEADKAGLRGEDARAFIFEEDEEVSDGIV